MSIPGGKYELPTDPEEPGYSNPDLHTIPSVPVTPDRDEDPNYDAEKEWAWIKENVHDKGWTVDWPRKMIVDDTGKDVGPLPFFYRTN